MKLRPWVKAVIGILFTISFCLLCGIVEIEFSLPAILMAIGLLAIFGGCGYLMCRFN